MKTTNNYGLKKPDGADLVNIEDLNYNADIIDAQLATKEGLIKSVTDKTSLVDTDTVPLSDSAASNATKKITFANLKASLKTYFDQFYNKYTHPAYTSRASNMYKFTVDGTGHVSGATAVAKADITGLGIPAQDTVYTHPTTAGNKHIPAGGTTDQVLKYGGVSGTAVWSSFEVGLPSGIIVMWSGAVNAIPEGWALCNGTNGTPDLRGRFVLGAGGTYAVDSIGGSSLVTLSINNLPSHNHNVTIGTAGSSHSHSFTVNNGSSGSSGTDYLKWSSSTGNATERTSTAGGDHSHGTSVSNTGSGTAHDNMPPYYALCYIMRTS